jgi:hypothetical protein
MKVKYFQDTDTLYIEFRSGGIVDTKDFDENTAIRKRSLEEAKRGGVRSPPQWQQYPYS